MSEQFFGKVELRTIPPSRKRSETWTYSYGLPAGRNAACEYGHDISETFDVAPDVKHIAVMVRRKVKRCGEVQHDVMLLTNFFD